MAQAESHTFAFCPATGQFPNSRIFHFMWACPKVKSRESWTCTLFRRRLCLCLCSQLQHPLRSFFFIQSQWVKILYLFLCYSLCPCCSALVSVSLCPCLCLCVCVSVCVFVCPHLPLCLCLWSGLVWSGLAIILCFCTYLSGAILASTVCALYVVPYHNLMYFLIFLVLCRVLV